MNKSTFTTCMMRVWQGGCASNYLHCGNVTHERHGGHKVISLSLRHHPVSYLLVSFFSQWCLFRRIRIVEVYYWVISQYWQALVMVLLPLDLPGTYSINYNHSHYTNVNRFCFCFQLVPIKYEYVFYQYAMRINIIFAFSLIRYLYECHERPLSMKIDILKTQFDEN